MTELQITRVKTLINALRSGKYKQGRNTLRRGNEFCCLGVACDLVDSTKWVSSSDNIFTTWESYNKFLPRSVMEFYGFRDMFGSFGSEGLSLTILNDKGVSFNEIAYIIEKQLINNTGLFNASNK